jgi:SPP1 family predicted phage head-tail adaptor
MQLGDLDRRIRIEQCTYTTDSVGQRIAVWSTLITVWAKIVYESGNEKYEANQKVAERIVKFIVRYRTLNETMRVVYDGRVYDILAIEDISRDRYLALRTLKKDRS